MRRATCNNILCSVPWSSKIQNAYASLFLDWEQLLGDHLESLVLPKSFSSEELGNIRICVTTST